MSKAEEEKPSDPPAKKVSFVGKPDIPDPANATSASGEPNPNLMSANQAAKLERRKASFARKQSLLGKIPPGHLTKLHKTVIQIERGNLETQEANVRAAALNAAESAAGKEKQMLLAEETKAADAEETEIPKHDGLRMLSRSDALYIEPAGKEFEQIFGVDMNHKYVVMNSLGERVFFATETLEEYCEAFSPHREVDISVFAGFGGLVFEVLGDTRNALVQIRQSRDMVEYVGWVNKASRISSTYKLFDQHKKEAFRLVRSRADEKMEVHEMPSEESVVEEEVLLGRDYRLFATDAPKTCIGEMNSHHEVFTRHHTTHSHHYGITFPLSLDLHSKILLCSALLLLNFLYFEKFSVGNRRSQACAGIIFLCLVVFLILVLLAGITTAVWFSKDYKPPPVNMTNKLPCNDDAR